MIDFVDIHRQLLSACREGDFDTVQRVLDHEVDGRTAEVDVESEDGFTPLQVAAGHGHEAIVRLLLRRGAALDRQNGHGWTALMQAASYGHKKIVQLLLQNKANPNIATKLGVSALTLTAHYGHTSVARVLLDVPGIDLNDKGPADVAHQAVTPLMASVHKGNDTIVHLLVDKGSCAFYRDQHTGWTPLMMAALKGHLTTAQILLDRGSDPNVTNAMDRTALEIATLAGQREITGFLDRKTTNRPKIFQKDTKPKIIEATEAGDIALIQGLLDKDPQQCNATSADGATPLMIAAMLGRFDITELLIQRKADVNKQDTKSGWTALMQATFHRRRHLVKYLVSVGADATLQAKDGCTALDLALVVVLNDNESGGDNELIRLLASVTMPSTNNIPKGLNESSVTLTGRTGSQLLGDDSPRNGLKAWWSRMSNRFRNLKLTRTLRAGLTTTKLMPFEEDDADVSAATMKLAQDASSGLGESRESDKRHQRKSDTKSQPDLNHSSNSVGKDSGVDVSIKSFQSAQTMIIPSPAYNQPNDKLLPVIPPFLPPPSFELNNSGRSSSRLSSHSSRTSLTQLANGQAAGTGQHTRKPNKLLFTRRSPSNSAYFSTTASPNSSGDTSTLSGGLSAARPPRLPTLMSSKSPREVVTKPAAIGNKEPLFMPAATYHNSKRSLPTPAQEKSLTAVTSPLPSTALTNSSTSSTTSGSLHHPTSKVRPLSGTSRSSTTNTLTPTPSPKLDMSFYNGSEADGKNSLSLQKKESSSSGVSEEDELTGMLKKLSLEKYTPIFEEQEVDMEAFLTLNESDLKELGISQSESRYQMLYAITELNADRSKTHHYPGYAESSMARIKGFEF